MLDRESYCAAFSVGSWPCSETRQHYPRYLTRQCGKLWWVHADLNIRKSRKLTFLSGKLTTLLCGEKVPCYIYCQLRHRLHDHGCGHTSKIHLCSIRPLYLLSTLYVIHVINCYWPSPTFPYCKWQKSGQLLWTRLDHAYRLLTAGNQICMQTEHRVMCVSVMTSLFYSLGQHVEKGLVKPFYQTICLRISGSAWYLPSGFPIDRGRIAAPLSHSNFVSTPHWTMI